MDSGWVKKVLDIYRVSYAAVYAVNCDVVTRKESEVKPENVGVVMKDNNEDLFSATKRKIEGKPVPKQP